MDERAARMADATRVWLAPHNPDWANMAEAEGARIAGAMGDAFLRVEHIGSTAIPGIVAKPVVDLMPVARSIEVVDERREAIEALGYRWRGEFGITGRRYCVLERDGLRLFHVHIFADGHPNIATQLMFRDYLRAHRDEALAYEAIKREAAAAHPYNSLAYNDHKSAWIVACRTRAKDWAAR
jgi:GrpB-like predicted nucleotidyltransferase (UPF0157 family)